MSVSVNRGYSATSTVRSFKIAKQLLQGDYALFPLAPGSNVPCPGTHGYKDAVTHMGQFDQWIKTFGPVNWGVLLGPDAGIIALDIDHKHGKANGYQQLTNLEAKLGPLPPTFTTHTPSGGQHRFFRCPALPDGRKFRDGGLPGHKHVEFKALHITGPWTIKKGKVYQPEGPLIPAPKLPELPEAWQSYLLEHKTVDLSTLPPVSELPACDKPHELAQVKSALESIIPDDYDTWVRVGMAMYHTFGDDVFSVWNEWSQQGRKYEGEAATFSKWKTFGRLYNGGKKLRVGTIYHLAMQAGWTPPKRPKGHLSKFLSGLVDDIPYPDKPEFLPVDEARAQLQSLIRRLLDDDDGTGLTVVMAELGLGKTEAVILISRELIEMGRVTPHMPLDWYVPSYDLAEELHQRLARHGIQARIIRGRNKDNCPRHELVKEIKGDVQSELCFQEHRDEETGALAACEKCPFLKQARCGYYRQMEEQAPVRIFTHAHLVLDKGVLDRVQGLPLDRYLQMSHEGREFHTVVPFASIIDESPLNTLERTPHLSLDLLAGYQPDPNDEHEQDIKTIYHALLNLYTNQQEQSWPALQAALHAFTIDDLEDMIKEHRERLKLSSRGPSRKNAEILADIEKRRKAGPLVTTLKALIWCLENQKPWHYQAVRANGYRLPYRAHLKRAGGKKLILDATGDPCCYQAHFPNCSIHQVRAQHNAILTQVSDSSFYTGSLVSGHDEATPRAHKVMGLLPRLSESFGGLGIIATKTVKEAFQTQFEQITPHLAHMGNMRGLDAMKDLPALAVIGRQEPSIQALELAARARFGPEIVDELTGQYERTPKPYHMADGQELGVYCHTHKSPRVQAILEQIREAEIEQAIGRVRAVNRDQPVPVFILSNIPTSLPVDHLVSMDDLQDAAKYWVWSTRAGGKPARSPQSMIDLCPDIWKTEKTAKNWLTHLNQVRSTGPKGPASLYEIIYRVSGPFGPVKQAGNSLAENATKVRTENTVATLLTGPVVALARRPLARLVGEADARALLRDIKGWGKEELQAYLTSQGRDGWEIWTYKPPRSQGEAFALVRKGTGQDAAREGLSLLYEGATVTVLSGPLVPVVQPQSVQEMEADIEALPFWQGLTKTLIRERERVMPPTLMEGLRRAYQHFQARHGGNNATEGLRRAYQHFQAQYGNSATEGLSKALKSIPVSDTALLGASMLKIYGRGGS